MMRSLYAGVSGLRSHQTMMDVVGDNIANINTPGFKGSRVVFQSQLAQVLSGGTAAVNPDGGTNPNQVGLGVRVGTIDASTTQGPVQNTGRPTDLAITGEGYFMVERGGDLLFTRSGAFGWDDAGNLTDPSGAVVQGWMPGADGTVDPSGPTGDITLDMAQPYDPAATPPATLRSVSIGTDGTITGTFSNGLSRPLGQVALAGFVNPAGLVSAGNGHLRPSASSGEATVGETGGVGRGTLAPGSLESSNVELAQEFTNLMIAQRGFQASSRIISTSDEMLQELVNLKR